MIKFVSEPYILQEEKMWDEQIITAGELLVNTNTRSLCKITLSYIAKKLHTQQENIIVPTLTVVHIFLDVTTITEVKKPKKCLQ